MSEPGGAFMLEQEWEFQALPSQVFGLLTEPADLAKWWGPHGFTIPELAIDLRVGGTYRFTMQPPDGEVFHLSGEFVEIEAPGRLSYTFRWDEPTPDDRETVVSLSMHPFGEATKLWLAQGNFATEERLELHRNGWVDSFEKLEGVIKSQGA